MKMGILMGIIAGFWVTFQERRNEKKRKWVPHPASVARYIGPYGRGIASLAV